MDDSVTQFAAACVVHQPNGFVRTMDLYEAYTAHLDAIGYIGPRAYFSRFPADVMAALESLGIPGVRGRSARSEAGRYRGFLHVAVRADAAGMQAVEQAVHEGQDHSDKKEHAASGEFPALCTQCAVCVLACIHQENARALCVRGWIPTLTALTKLHRPLHTNNPPT